MPTWLLPQSQLMCVSEYCECWMGASPWIWFDLLHFAHIAASVCSFSLFTRVAYWCIYNKWFIRCDVRTNKKSNKGESDEKEKELQLRIWMCVCVCARANICVGAYDVHRRFHLRLMVDISPAKYTHNFIFIIECVCVCVFNHKCALIDFLRAKHTHFKAQSIILHVMQRWSKNHVLMHSMLEMDMREYLTTFWKSNCQFIVLADVRAKQRNASLLLIISFSCTNRLSRKKLIIKYSSLNGSHIREPISSILLSLFVFFVHSSYT